MLTVALLLLAGMTDEVQITPTTWRFYDPEFGVVCYLNRDKALAPSLACLAVTYSPSAPSTGKQPPKK